MTFESIEFHDPSRWALFLLLLLPVIWWRHFSTKRRSAVRFSTLQFLRAQRPTLKSRCRHLIPLLRTLSMALLIVCVARPQKGDEQTWVQAEGIAIQLVVDLSGSMEAMDFDIEGRKVNRLEAIKKVSREFLLGNSEELKGRPDDLVGLIVFGTYPDSLAPMTLDHDMVLQILDDTESYGSIERQKQIQELRRQWNGLTGPFGQIQPGAEARVRSLQAEMQVLQEEQATAIGDALALGVERLQSLHRDEHREGHERIKSKVMILLTDGSQTAGDLEPLAAADLAQEMDIRVYTIGVGTNGRFMMPVVDSRGNVHYEEPRDYRGLRIDEATLERVAESTGGKYFRADNTEALRKIYSEIDQLERTETEERRFKQYKEMATQWTEIRGWNVPPLLLGVLMLLGLEVVLANTWLRKMP